MLSVLVVSRALPVDDIAQSRGGAGSRVLISFHVSAAGLFAYGPQAESDLLFLRIHLDDLEVMLAAGLHVHGLAIAIYRFGVVAEALDAFGNFNECSKASHAQHLALEHVSNMMLLEERLPDIGLKLFHAQ